MYLLPWGILTVLIALIDAVSKNIISSSMRLHESIPVIEDVFHITYVINKGASFGMLQGGRWLFILVTLIIIGFIVGYTIRKKEKNK